MTALFSKKGGKKSSDIDFRIMRKEERATFFEFLTKVGWVEADQPFEFDQNWSHAKIRKAARDNAVLMNADLLIETEDESFSSSPFNNYVYYVWRRTHDGLPLPPGFTVPPLMLMQQLIMHRMSMQRGGAPQQMPPGVPGGPGGPYGPPQGRPPGQIQGQPPGQRPGAANPFMVGGPQGQPPQQKPPGQPPGQGPPKPPDQKVPQPGGIKSEGPQFGHSLKMDELPQESKPKEPLATQQAAPQQPAKAPQPSQPERPAQPSPQPPQQPGRPPQQQPQPPQQRPQGQPQTQVPPQGQPRPQQPQAQQPPGPAQPGQQGAPSAAPQACPRCKQPLSALPDGRRQCRNCGTVV